MPRHLPVLDGLRAMAVLLVLWCHVPIATPGYPGWLGLAHAVVGPGGLGVDIFFVLSGFLITRILIAERDAARPVRWFLLRRVLRIFPIYYLLLLVMLAIEPRREIGWCAAYLYNFHSIAHPNSAWALGHTWSLCIEEHFYLLWPLALAFGSRALPQRLLLFVIMPAAVVGAWLVGLYGDPGSAMNTVQHGSPFRFLSLGAGALLAFAEPRIGARSVRWALLAGLLLVPGLLLHPGFVFWIAPQWLGGELLAPRHAPVLWLVHSCCVSTGILLLCLTAAGPRWSPLHWLQAVPLRAVGRISYGLYLYHLPIYHWLLLPQPSGGRVVLALAVSFGVAAASYFAVERPILRRSARLR